MEKLSADLLITLTGALLSLAAFYLPFFRRAIESMGEYKFTFMAGTLLVVACLYTAIWCKFGWTCIQAELPSMLLVWIGCLGMNQGAYQLKVKKEKERLKDSQ